MTANGLYRILSWLTVILPLLGGLAGVGALITQKIVDGRKDAEIAELKPRSISAEQREILLRVLRDAPGRVAFLARMMDGEGRSYAERLAEVFREAGWQVISIAGNTLVDLPGIVTIACDATLLPVGNRIIAAFMDAGITRQPGSDIQPGAIPGPLEHDTIYVIVGRKA